MEKFSQLIKFINKINTYGPRSETIIVFCGLICSLSAKIVVLNIRQISLNELFYIVFPDIVFFTAVFSVICTLYVISPSRWMSRLVLTLSTLVLLWSILNAVWLIESGVQLQPCTLKILFRGFKQVWPVLQTRITAEIYQTIFFGFSIVLLSVLVLWRFVNPSAINTRRFTRSIYAAASIIVIIILTIVKPAPPSNMGFSGNMLGFSSHWYSLNYILENQSNHQIPLQLRNIPGIGQRKISLPACQKDKLPNVVIVLLESISFSASELGKPYSENMPVLRQIAKQSAEFKNTMVLLPYTTKAFWTILTSTTPNTQADYIEAIPAERPYESLASILSRAGYRSAFFEMSKGSFECAPGLFFNLAFDWASFRENLNDPAAYLTPLTGDDCRMIEPAFEWAKKEKSPFLLMMITSVSHDPYKVPDWFEDCKTDAYERYLQTIRYTDYFLAKICAELKRNGFEDNTILCIMGDHGTSFRSKMGAGRWIPYDEVIKVPWIIRWHGHIQAGQCIEWPCSQLDVTPTILSVAGFDIHQSNFEGKNAFVPSDPNKRFYFSSWYPNSPAGFIENNKKIVYWPDIDKVFKYDLISDPNEECPQISAACEKEKYKNDILKWLAETQINIDPRRHSEHFLYSHWQIFTTGRTGWTYYVK